jgi:hypothetical protein
VFSSRLAPVPANRVQGDGRLALRLDGDVATITARSNRLVNAAHLMHIHAGAAGRCPDRSMARRHNGRLAISTQNGLAAYGLPVTALTTRGDTRPDSKLAFDRSPAGGDFRYSRTIRLTGRVRQFIRANNAVIVVHGIDYNGNAIYDDILGESEFDAAVYGETTAPALCAPLLRETVTRAGGASVYTASLAPVESRPAPLCPLGVRAVMHRPGGADHAAT